MASPDHPKSSPIRVMSDVFAGTSAVMSVANAEIWKVNALRPLVTAVRSYFSLLPASEASRQRVEQLFSPVLNTITALGSAQTEFALEAILALSCIAMFARARRKARIEAMAEAEVIRQHGTALESTSTRRPAR